MEQTTNPAEGVAQSMEDRIAASMGLADDPIEQAEPEEPAEPQAQADSQEQSAEAQGEEKTESSLPEVEDVEYEGKQYKLPKELKEALMRQRDYTQKTQETAEMRRTADTLMQQAKQTFELQRALQKPLAKVYAFDEQIAQYEKVDWNALMAQDATEAQKHFMAFQTLKDSRQKALGEVQGMQSQMMQESQKAHSARLEEGLKTLQREIKGWNAELGMKIAKFSQENYGLTAEEAASIYDPRTVRMLHDAMQWRSLQASKSQIQNKVPVAQQKTLKPQASEQRTANQQMADQYQSAMKSAKTSSEKAKIIERRIASKL